jgi:hypothetical protein
LRLKKHHHGHDTSATPQQNSSHQIEFREKILLTSEGLEQKWKMPDPSNYYSGKIRTIPSALHQPAMEPLVSLAAGFGITHARVDIP